LQRSQQSTLRISRCQLAGMFGSVVTIAFQITFRAEIHANDIFLFFKNYFWHQHIKTIQNILNFSKKKNWFFWKHGLHRVPKQFRCNNDKYFEADNRKRRKKTTRDQEQRDGVFIIIAIGSDKKPSSFRKDLRLFERIIVFWNIFYNKMNQNNIFFYF
jgi:hypothetical protein